MVFTRGSFFKKFGAAIMVSQGQRDFEGLPDHESGAEIAASLANKRDDRVKATITTDDETTESISDNTANHHEDESDDDQPSLDCQHHVETREVDAIQHSRNLSQHLGTSNKVQNLTLDCESQMLLSGVQTIPEQLPLILTEGDAEEQESLRIIAGNEQLQGVSTQAVLGNNNGAGASGLMVFSSTEISPSGQIIPIGGTNLLVLQSVDGQHQVFQPSTVIVHPKQTQVGQKETVQPSEEKANVKQYKCPEPGCSKVAPSAAKLKLHMLSHTGERPHKCPSAGCDWAFTTAYKLKRHMRGHTGEKPFICEINNCGKSFTTTYNLKTHQKAHIREQANICSFPDCGLSFTTLHRLRVHEKKHVVRHEEHTCTINGCGKQFKTLAYYNTHLKTHTGERPHVCTFEGCDKRFTKASKLKLHIRTHTGERPFVCEVEGCSWSFTSAYKLKRHGRKHSGERPYSCQFSGCGKSFTRASHMRTHQMSHTGQKPFICSYQNCRKAFTAASTLTIHLRKHAGDKPFKCTVEGCDKAYTTAANLRLHQKRHEEKIDTPPDETVEEEEDHVSDQQTSIHYVEIGGVNSVVGTSPHSVPNTPYSVMHTFTGEDFASEDVASLTVVQFSSEETFPPQTPVSTIDSSQGICFQFSTNDSYVTTSHSNASSSISNLSFTTVTPLPSPGTHYVQATIEEEVDVEGSGELSPSHRSSNTDQANSEGYVIQERTAGSEGYIEQPSHTEEYIVQEQASSTQGFIVREHPPGTDGYIIREENSPSDGYIVREQSSQTEGYILRAQKSGRGKSSDDLTLPTMVVFTSPEVQSSGHSNVVRADTDVTDTESHGDGSSENNHGALTLRQRSESSSIGQFAPPAIIFQGEEVKQPEVEPKLNHGSSSNIHNKHPRRSDLFLPRILRRNSNIAGLPVSNLGLNLSLSDDIDKSPVSPFIADVHDHHLDHESTINIQDLR